MKSLFVYLDGLQAKVNALPAPCSSGRLQSPWLHFGDGSQSVGGGTVRVDAVRAGCGVQRRTVKDMTGVLYHF